MEQSLANSNTVINTSTDIILKALLEKTYEWATKERSMLWYPKAEQIVKLSKETYNYLENAKRELKEKELSIDMLNEKMFKFHQDILNTDSSIRVTFNSDPMFISPITKVTGSATLTALQNNIKIIENKVIAFCNNKVGIIWDGFDSYSVIIGQSSNYLKPGDALEITAGVGAFSKAGQPEIIIGDSTVEISEEGCALYKIKVSNKPGQYKIPVKIDFLNQTTGKNEKLEKNIEYTVAKPCN